MGFIVPVQKTKCTRTVGRRNVKWSKCKCDIFLWKTTSDQWLDMMNLVKKLEILKNLIMCKETAIGVI